MYTREDALRYQCHKLRSQLWDLKNERERYEAFRWVKGHIGESLKTASYEELTNLKYYFEYKLENGHCPLHETENASVRYKRDGGSPNARKRVREELVAQFGEKCVGCGRDDVPLTLDHIHPIALGGKNEVSNAQLLCVPCHVKKTKKDSKVAFERFFETMFPEKAAKRKAALAEAARIAAGGEPVAVVGEVSVADTRTVAPPPYRTRSASAAAPSTTTGSVATTIDRRPRRRGRRGGRRVAEARRAAASVGQSASASLPPTANDTPLPGDRQ